MNLYDYLMSKSNNTTRAAAEAKEAYARFQACIRTKLEPQRLDVNPFAFVFVDHGYQAFAFKPDQVVDAKGELAIVTGWADTHTGWKVCTKTAKGEPYWEAEELKPAAFPEGLVEILRGRVHGKVDEAFA